MIKFPAPLSFVSGALMALAMPPVQLWPVIFLCVPLFLLCLSTAQSRKAAFGLSWLFGFGFFLCSLYWIAHALWIDIARYWWALPFALSVLPALLSLFWALAGTLSWLLAQAGKRYRLLILFLGWSASIAVFEMLRGVLFSGFPWNLLVESWTGMLVMLQALDRLGLYAVNGLSWLWAGLPFLFYALLHNKRSVLTLAVLILSGLSLGLNIGYGSWKLGNAPPLQPSAAGPQIALIQPAIPQAEKWDPALQEREQDRLVKLTLKSANAAGNRPVWVIWPETAILQTSADLPGQLLKEFPDGSRLMTGLLRWQQSPQGVRRYYNSLAVYEKGSNAPVALYDKHKLVPFGEYMPLSKWINLAPLTGIEDFTPGPLPRPFPVSEDHTIWPLVCYEILFPGMSPARDKEDAVLINVTNDAWYGTSAGPYQHLSKARLRAIQSRKTVIRAANTGISAVYDRYGRELARIDLNRAGFRILEGL